MPESKQFSVRVTEDVAEILVARCHATGETMSDVLRKLIDIALSRGEPATPVSTINGDPNAVAAAVAGEVKPLFAEIATAWTTLSDQMQDMATTVGKYREETEAVNAQVKLLRRDLRTLIRTLDDCLSHEDQAATPATSSPEENDHA